MDLTGIKSFTGNKRLITGAFKTTASGTLDYHAALISTELRLNESVYKAAVRISTLPQHHPLFKPVQRCLRWYPAAHRGPLHEVFAAFPDVRHVDRDARADAFIPLLDPTFLCGSNAMRSGSHEASALLDNVCFCDESTLWKWCWCDGCGHGQKEDPWYIESTSRETEGPTL